MQPEDLMPLVAWCMATGVLGLLVGSFLNVVILRLPSRLEHGWRRECEHFLGLDRSAPPDWTHQESGAHWEPTAAPLLEPDQIPPGLIREPSHCPSCKHRLRPWENVPVLSWIVLRGRCSSCGCRVSIQYPAVELLTGLLSALVVYRYGPTFEAATGLLFTWFLIALSGIDLRKQLLPDSLTLPLLWLGLLVNLDGVLVPIEQAVIGAVAGYLSLWTVYQAFKLATGKEGMGYGDFKLLAALGAWLGWSALLPIVLIASVLGAIIGGVWLWLAKAGQSKPIPFGPFLALAGWLVLVANEAIYPWLAVLAPTP